MMDIPAFFSRFPLHTYPPVGVQTRLQVVQPTLWIAPPRNAAALLSTDVECLTWQAYLALRGLNHIAVRWDISPEGALDARLPNLHLPDASPRLLPPRSIPAWADERLNHAPDPLDGYRDQSAKDESHAWIALLEGAVHAALVRSPPPPLSSLIASLVPLPTRRFSLQVQLRQKSRHSYGSESSASPFDRLYFSLSSLWCQDRFVLGPSALC